MESRIIICPVSVEQIIDLRQQVLRAGLARETARFDGDDEPTTLHLAALAGQRVIACGTLMRRPYEGQAALQLRGMAVHADYRGLGIGAELLAEVHRAARDAGLTLLWANARKVAVGFYRRYGWQIVSGEFEIPLAGPHYKMTRTLAAGEP